MHKGITLEFDANYLLANTCNFGCPEQSRCVGKRDEMRQPADYTDKLHPCMAVVVRMFPIGKQIRSMKRSLNASRMVVVCAAAVVAALNLASAQEPTRRFAPGVLTTIPPAPQAEEMFSGPRPLVELPIAIKDLQYEPKLGSVSATVFERSQGVLLRRTIWNLEFSFKPMRMIYVDVPQASGRMQRQLVWYMVYRVRNLGNHLKPKGLITAETIAEDKNPNDEVLELVEPTVPDPRELYGKFKDFTNEVEAFGGKLSDKLRFFPHFVLRSTEYKKEYLDRPIPAALGPIMRREFPGRPDQVLHNSLSISEVPIAISDDNKDNSVWGVVTWTDVDPRIDYFMVYVQGLTNAYQFEDPAGAYKAGDEPGTGRKITRKTLQLNFWRPGDTVDPNEEEIRYGCRLDPDPAEQEKILKEYGVQKPVDHVWVYR
jgi:hypothetical protein